MFNIFDKYFVIPHETSGNEKFDKSPFNYLIYVNRCNNIGKMNLINNNLFEEEFKNKYVNEDYKISLRNVNFMGQNLIYNFIYFHEKLNCQQLYANASNIYYDNGKGYLSSLLFKYNIINEKFTTTSEHTLTLEEYVRKIANFLLNIPI